MDARNLLSLSGVLLVLGGGAYYWGMGQSSHTLLGTDNPQLPDYVASNIESWQTGPDGQLLRHMQADSIVHYRSPEQAVISKPVAWLYHNGQPEWRVSSASGTVSDNNSEVHLQDNVHGQRIDPTAAPVQFDTTAIDMNNDNQTVTTNEKVVVKTTGSNQISSTGLDADMKTNTLNLHSEVQGTYVTHP